MSAGDFREEVFSTVSDNWLYVLGFVFATIADGTSTIYALTKPGVEEANPVTQFFIANGTNLSTTLYIYLAPIALLVVILLAWARSGNKDFYRTLTEGGITIQTTAAIHNTLLYFNRGTVWTIVALIALASHYFTRLYINYKRHKDNQVLLSKLPQTRP